ncbi:Uncharacterized protein Fot_53744 [Forsythia ovata]|uniref:Uncharacterized protein n=1 Tax=Forsythia ovata TaxID=205694 RepID=A0ABD1PF54_9LAMI
MLHSIQVRIKATTKLKNFIGHGQSSHKMWSLEKPFYEELPTKADDKRSPFEYCKGNSSAIEYSLGLKLIGLDIEDVSFATDQTKRHLDVGNIGYESYDSLAKRCLLVLFELFFRIYYKGDMLGEQSVSLPRANFMHKMRNPYGHKGQLRAYFRHLKRGIKYLFQFGNSLGGVGFRGLRWTLGRCLRLSIERCYA